jgi:hypothetical protein
MEEQKPPEQLTQKIKSLEQKMIQQKSPEQMTQKKVTRTKDERAKLNRTNDKKESHSNKR